MTEELKFCPFCGRYKAPSLRQLQQSKYILCDESKGGCGAQGPYKRWADDAVEAWNRRA
jgi:Lar family restriction alleviation protein